VLGKASVVCLDRPTDKEVFCTVPTTILPQKKFLKKFLAIEIKCKLILL